MQGNVINTSKQTYRRKKVLRLPIDYSMLEAMKKALRGININNVYRSDLEYDNLHDIVNEWIKQFAPDLSYNEKTPNMPYLESENCSANDWCCYLDLVLEDREYSAGRPYALCRELNGDEWMIVIKYAYLYSINPSMHQFLLMRSVEILWLDTEDQPDGYINKNAGGAK